MKKYVMALDQGTSSSRCIIYDKQGRSISTCKKETTSLYPNDGWVEQDPMEIWSTQMGVAQEAMHMVGITYKNIDSIGITNQRETVIAWNKVTGQPVYNAISWQCKRTAEYCSKLIEDGYSQIIKEKTGLLIDSYFSATKIKWMIENIPLVNETLDEGNLLVGTVETWLIWKLTSGRVHITDYSNASRTMIFNIDNLCWDEELLDIFNIEKSILPEPVSSSKIYGYTDDHYFGEPIAISGAAGDQQAALFGQGCFQNGQCKMTYGTGGFMLMNTGTERVKSENGLLTTIAWGVGSKVYYALEGSVFIAGAAVQWLRDGLGIIDRAADTAEIALSVADSGGIYFVPAFVGYGAPYWNQYARGTMIGITRDTDRKHIVRATLESMTYQTKDLIDAVERDMKASVQKLNLDGGASENVFLVQHLADVSQGKVFQAADKETTALGAAYLAGLATGYWKNEGEIVSLKKDGICYSPKIEKEEADIAMKGWHRAVERAMDWSSE